MKYSIVNPKNCFRKQVNQTQKTLELILCQSNFQASLPTILAVAWLQDSLVKGWNLQANAPLDMVELFEDLLGVVLDSCSDVVQTLVSFPGHFF